MGLRMACTRKFVKKVKIKNNLHRMPRFNEKKIPYAKQNELMDEFCDILSRLGTKEKIYNFLKDLLNRKERMMIIRRLLIAKLLEQNKKYKEIKDELGCGGSTIAKVQRWLHFGRGGYKEAIYAPKKE
ncbi:hypothetical protein A2482_00900 [Candidatus Falkowbacteria bacterium RIFOXYC2_FULL_48_21]|uniref:TrpR like protein, YerC/YecD n=1 Tax=Candidatus Falkowbacteria bacterium RIFOXYC2_FULL_48_21 TaxID=1798005 RepID=A0A1F5T902_9BACT|nr:MAG: hypothetical protein A2482_00900 [Candidatus Falkowbacteria bacterium RIFOXYC2_FULL_48_21]